MPAMLSKPLSRRELLGALGFAAASACLSAAEKPALARFKLIGFVKPFQRLPFEQLADTAREVGWSGIECPVRKDGAIEPERAEEDLPKLVELLRSRELELSVISTDVEDASNPLGLRVLKTASKLGVPRYRLKHYYYDLNQPIAPQLENFKAMVRDLAQLNRELNLQGAIQNHSGRNYVGAPVWDLWEMVRGLDPRSMGIFFDIGHATVEGGTSWPIEAKLAEPHLSVVSVKDFQWVKRDGGWRTEWCPLGQGMVRRDFFSALRKSAFNGPITQHFEYSVGTGKEMIAAMRKELQVLQEWIS